MLVSVDRESMSGLAGLPSNCWLGLQLSEDLTGVGGLASKMAYSHGRWQNSSLPYELLHRVY